MVERHDELPSTIRRQDVLGFHELRPFTQRWHKLQLSDDALHTLQRLLMADPVAGDVIAGTGGLRKVRFAPPGKATGKRDALRVVYAHYPTVATVIFGAVYAKSERSDLTAANKAVLRTVIGRFERMLLSRPYRAGQED